MNFAPVLSGCKCTSFFKTRKKKNYFFSNASEIVLSKTGMQTYNLFQSTSKLFQRTFCFPFTTQKLFPKADAKIKSISFTIQVKIQKFSENLSASKSCYIKAQLSLHLLTYSLSKRLQIYNRIPLPQVF